MYINIILKLYKMRYNIKPMTFKNNTNCLKLKIRNSKRVNYIYLYEQAVLRIELMQKKRDFSFFLPNTYCI